MDEFTFETHTIRFLCQGEGTPLVFLHNAGNDHFIWKYQIDFFKNSFRVYALDLLGYGQSDRPDIPYVLNLHVKMLTEFVDKQLSQPFVLIGNCIGSAIAIEYAASFPDKVQALVLFNVCGGKPMIESTIPLFLRTKNPLPKWLYFAFFKAINPIRPLKKRLIYTLYGKRPRHQDEVFDHLYKTSLQEAQHNSRYNLIRGLHTYNKFGLPFTRPPSLPPTLLFWGAMNKVLPLSEGLKFKDSIEPDRFVQIENCGHMAMSENPQLVNQKILDFLREHGLK